MMHVNFYPFPVLFTERLVLRRITDGDANELFFLRSDEGIMKYICKPKPKNLDDILQFIEKINSMIGANQGVAWAVTLKNEDKLIGHISFHQIFKEHFRAEVGYMLYPDYYGQNIMHEALKAVLDYGFNTIGLHSVEANVSPENIRSRKLLEKNNFMQEAHFKENYFWE